MTLPRPKGGSKPGTQSRPARWPSPLYSTRKATKPEKTFRIGLLKATIWKNPTEKRHYYSVDLVCSYSDKDGAWQETTSLGHDDLLNAATLAKRAEVWIAS